MSGARLCAAVVAVVGLASVTLAGAGQTVASTAVPATIAALVPARVLSPSTPVPVGSCRSGARDDASCDSIRGRSISAAGLRTLVARERSIAHSRLAAVGAVGARDGAASSVAHQGTAPENGYGPSDLAAMYGVPATGVPTTTIGIIDWHQDPTVAADLATYRAKFGLPACTTASGCFTELAANGGNVSVANKSEVGEISLDVEAVSAICPTCHITLVDAANGSTAALFPAVKSLATSGVHFISMSWSTPEDSASPAHDSYFAQPDTTYVAASGDNGYNDGSGRCGGRPLCFPASAPGVIAAGGVSTTEDSHYFYFGAWKGAGSGCARYAAEPPAQAAAIGNPCDGEKGVADVSALADPNTGAATYSTANGWGVYGGTSLATPLITALYALSGNSTNPYSLYANNAAAPGLALDVTTGASTGCNGLAVCTAAVGWDGPTGLGVPLTPELFADNPDLSITLTAVHGTAATIPLGQTVSGAAFSATGGSGQYRWSATGLPSGLSLDPASGAWSGTPTSGGTYSIEVTATDAQKASSATSATFILIVQSPLHLSTASGAKASVLALQGYAVDTAPVAAQGASAPLTWAARGLPTGLTMSPASGVLTGKPSKVGDSQVVVSATTTSGDTATIKVDFEVVRVYTCNAHLATHTGARFSDDCGADWSKTPSKGIGWMRLPGSLSYIAKGLPAGLRITARSGVVSGTPRRRGSGSFHVITSIRPNGVMLTKPTSLTFTVTYTVSA